MAKVTDGPSRSARPREDQSLCPWPGGTPGVLRTPLCYRNTRIQEFRDLGEGSNLKMGTMGSDPGLKLPLL